MTSQFESPLAFPGIHRGMAAAAASGGVYTAPAGQNYKTVRDVTQVTWEDLEDIGIVKLGHQKKILLAIKRVKDIISGKWNPGGANAYQQQVRSG